MSDERRPPSDGDEKRPVGAGDEVDPDAPPSAEEVLASKRLRDALEDPSLAALASPEDLELVSALHAAWSPEPLDVRAHAEILDDLPNSAEEIALAAELREALEAKDGAPELVTALRSAWSPAVLGEAEHDAILAKALGEAHEQGRSNVVTLKPRARRMRLAVVTTTTVLALAASIVVWVTSAPERAEAPLARARSTQPLFDEPFKAGETSARIDRIAVARASDYRDNRFAKWGVR
jgi:hypothetical protein